MRDAQEPITLTFGNDIISPHKMDIIIYPYPKLNIEFDKFDIEFELNKTNIETAKLFSLT